MKIYSIDVKEHSRHGYYSRFIVLGETINDMLENLYKELCSEEESIPYYLRSSNFIITCLGDFIPNDKIKIKEKILCSDYISWDD